MNDNSDDTKVHFESLIMIHAMFSKQGSEFVTAKFSPLVMGGEWDRVFWLCLAISALKHAAKSADDDAPPGLISDAKELLSQVPEVFLEMVD